MLERLTNGACKVVPRHGAGDHNGRAGCKRCDAHRLSTGLDEDDRLEPGYELPRLADAA